MADEHGIPDEPTGAKPEQAPETSSETAMPSAAPTRDMSDLRSGVTPGIPKQVGQYRIKRAIASGGMGTVYEALQERPRRTVAVKFMRAGIASPSALRRFEYEAQLLARLRHPGIAQIYEAGTHREGDVDVPFFAMEYIVAARPITDYVKEKKLGTRERIRLFIQVCEAVHHGHQKGIIHRDLKPSNILVDSSGRVKIIDFGVARSTDSDMAVTTLQTDVGALLGTLQYMSPEQCAADPHDIDTRSDVYTLGVILYEILTGQVPYEVKAAVLHEATRIIREQQPTRPSTIDRALRGDLETIALTALEKDRDRRYQSASALTADLKRYLNSEAISARPPSMAYQLKVFARRNKGVFGAAAAVFVVLVAGMVVSTTLYFQAEGARSEAAARAADLEKVATFQEEQLKGIDVPMMGIHMRQGLLEKAREAASRAEEAADPRVAELESRLAGVNFTDLSLSLLDRDVFEPAATAIKEQFSSQPLLQARLMQALASTIRDLGLLEQATPLQEQALAIRRQHLGDEHPDALISLHQSGILQAYKGDLEEAEKSVRAAADGYRRVLGEDNPKTYDGLGDIGIVLLNAGRVEEAEQYFRQALEGAIRTAGEDDPLTLMSYNNLGVAASRLGKTEEAEVLYRKSLEGHQRIFGADDEKTLTSSYNLSQWLKKVGRIDEAESQQREALEGMRRVLGDRHPRTLLVIHTLAHLLLEETDNQAEAETLFRESYEGTRTTFGADDRQTVKNAGCYGFYLNSMDRPAEAEPYLRARLEGYKAIYGEEHDYTLQSLSNLAHSLNRQGRHREALEMTARLETAAREEWAEDHGRLGTYLAKIGEARTGVGDYAAAEKALLEAHELQAGALGEDDRRTRESVEQIVALYERWDKFAPERGHAGEAARWRGLMSGGEENRRN